MCRENRSSAGSSGDSSGWSPLSVIGATVVVAILVHTAAAHATAVEAAIVWLLIRLAIAAGVVVGFMLSVIILVATTRAGYTWLALRGVFRATVWSGRSLFRGSIWSGRHLYRLIHWCVWRLRLAHARRRFRRLALYEARAQTSLTDVPEEVQIPTLLALPAPGEMVARGWSVCGCGCSGCSQTPPEHCGGPHCGRAHLREIAAKEQED